MRWSRSRRSPSWGADDGTGPTRSGSGIIGTVIGAIIMIFVLIVAIPVGFLMTMGGLAALLGGITKADADKRYEGSELLDIA